MYARVTPENLLVLKTAVRGKSVLDLGCGDSRLAEMLLDEATTITGVDRDEFVALDNPRHVFIRGRFDTLGMLSADVALLSWPMNYAMTGLVDILQNCAEVVYLGCNTGGTACGGHDLWHHLFARSVKAYIPDRENTLIHYGGTMETRDARPLLGEELAATTRIGAIMAFEAAEAAANVLAREGICYARENSDS